MSGFLARWLTRIGLGRVSVSFGLGANGTAIVPATRAKASTRVEVTLMASTRADTTLMASTRVEATLIL